jgi:putative spermidine/putrescine transport system permease protein
MSLLAIQSPEGFRAHATVERVPGGTSSILLAAPAALFILVWFVVPIARFCSLAFSGEAGAFASFAILFGSDAYRRVLLTTLGNAAEVTGAALLLAWPIGYVLSRLRGLWFVLVLYGVLFPFWISILVRTFAWMLLLERYGPVNRTLISLGLTDRPLNMLFNGVSVFIATVHVLLPYAILPLYAAMRRVDPRLILASEGLGASLVHTFRHVYFPMILPGLLGAGALVFTLSLGFFVTPALLGGASSITLATLISGFVTDRLAWSLAAAASIVLLALVSISMLVAGRLMRVGTRRIGR